jgi:hypothetical protein
MCSICHPALRSRPATGELRWPFVAGIAKKMTFLSESGLRGNALRGSEDLNIPYTKRFGGPGRAFRKFSQDGHAERNC